MVSFSCEVCQETLKKAKLDQHFNKCPNAQFTCIDCSVTFYGNAYKLHTSCISEDQKYQKSLYKPKKGSAQASQSTQQAENKAVEKQRPGDKLQSSTLASSSSNKGANGYEPNYAQAPKSEPLITEIMKQSKKRAPEEDDVHVLEPEKIKKKKKKQKEAESDILVVDIPTTVDTSAFSLPSVKTKKSSSNVSTFKTTPVPLFRPASAPMGAGFKTSLLDIEPAVMPDTPSTETDLIAGVSPGSTPVWTRSAKSMRQTVSKLAATPQIIELFQEAMKEAFTERGTQVSLGELSDYVASLTAHRLKEQGIVLKAKDLMRLPNLFAMHAMVTSSSKRPGQFIITIPDTVVPLDERTVLHAPNAPDSPEDIDEGGLGWVIDKNPTPVAI
ncbi:hypothetical protein SmJEL517_g03564 [Synchytrium microbalum]|uniref:Zinc finger C2H2 LYAR-type domain-containing protein n=1 Tax=Synchytrium microbalum TaxID=1806994 RepID=A0A507C1K1_9FUNG|nr:uncharacterized protein SmJEL517_g03564 [Synchytrium microbalum]TPX33582.1 hypothetical protein SmJEL517_g03564 [Synchytrium microbalum]